MTRRRNYCCKEVLPFAALVTAECTSVGVNILYKAAVSKGLSYHVFMVYSYAISALLVLPLAYFFHRKTRLPPFTLLLLGKFFTLGFLGFTGQFLGYKGIKLSNPTLGSAMSNVTPASTFLLAVLFRMEKIKLGSTSSQAKIIGTVVTLAGAFVVVLYNGPTLITTQDENSVVPSPKNVVLRLVSGQSSWVLGGALLALGYIVSSFWYIIQAKVVTEFPAEFIIVLFYNLSAGIISLPVCMISEPNLRAWIVPQDIRLLSIIYSGLMGSGFGVIVHTWALHVKGPVYVALFRPLSIAITAFLGVIFLGDNLYLGTVIGSVIISMGFYTVVWGKSKEELNEISISHSNIESPDDGVVPLLKHHSVSTKGNAFCPDFRRASISLFKEIYPGEEFFFVKKSSDEQVDDTSELD